MGGEKTLPKDDTFEYLSQTGPNCRASNFYGRVYRSRLPSPHAPSITLRSNGRGGDTLTYPAFSVIQGIATAGAQKNKKAANTYNDLVPGHLK